jgi:hypothetical protein
MSKPISVVPISSESCRLDGDRHSGNLPVEAIAVRDLLPLVKRNHAWSRDATVVRLQKVR